MTIRTGDKEFFIIGGLLLLMLIVWAFLTGRLAGLGVSLPSYSYGQPGMVVPTYSGGGSDPWASVVPGFNDPGSGSWVPPDINIDVHGQPIGYLAPYFPLFGFVGVDSAMVFQ
jgi:hypothetical protein